MRYPARLPRCAPDRLPLSLGGRRRGGLPSLPVGYAYVVDSNGAYVVDSNGAYVIASIS